MSCKDWKGNEVNIGEDYHPNSDPCYTCTCQAGYGSACRTVSCNVPDCDLFEPVRERCCEFHCIWPPDHPNAAGRNRTRIKADFPTIVHNGGTADLALHLAASSVTSLLFLALVLFMIHRLRKRRTIIMMQRFNADQRQDEEDAVSNLSQYDEHASGENFTPLDDEPPPPYFPLKSLHDGRQNADILLPPPYDDIIATNTSPTAVVFPTLDNNGNVERIPVEPAATVASSNLLMVTTDDDKDSCDRDDAER